MERITIQNIRTKIACEADAYVYVENLRWNGQPVCAHCGSDHVNLLNPANGISRKTRTGSMSQRRVWKCYTCRKQFSVTTGTVFHGSKVSLEIWIFIFFEMCANKNGLAAREVQRKYGLTAKTSWFVTQRIREAMRREPLSGMIANTTIEADETWIGGKPKNKHQQGRERPGGGRGVAGTPSTWSRCCRWSIARVARSTPRSSTT
jgi:transposase-like protein